MDKYDQLEKLKRLQDSGAISEAEYEAEKAKVLAARQSVVSSQFWGLQEREYLMFMHLSILAGIVVPLAGLVLPIVMWAMAKEYSKTADAHGRVILNWIISWAIYFVVCFILVFIFIGVPLIFLLTIASIVFSVIGAVKASKGELWAYPGSIPFFKPNAVDNDVL